MWLNVIWLSSLPYNKENLHCALDQGVLSEGSLRKCPLK